MSFDAVTVRNRFRGRIREIVTGSGVSAVGVETPMGIATSVITTRSSRDLGFTVGAEVAAPVKSREVALAVL